MPFKLSFSVVFILKLMFCELGKSRVFIDFITMPYVCYIHLNAMFKSLYRMFISHKNLLNWITAEDASKTINNKLSTFLKAFKPNYVMIFLTIILSILNTSYLIIGIIVSVLFLIAPLLLWRVSKENKKDYLN